MRVKRVGGRARPSSTVLPISYSIPRSASILHRVESFGGGFDDYSSESVSIEACSEGGGVASDSGGERVCVNGGKSPFGFVFGVDVTHDSGGEAPVGYVKGVNGNECDVGNVSSDVGGERVCSNAGKRPVGYDFGVDGSERDCVNVIPGYGGERACANVEKLRKSFGGNGNNECDGVNVSPDSGGERGCANVEKLQKSFGGNGNNECDVVNVASDSGGGRACVNIEKPQKNFDGNGNNEFDVGNVTLDSGGERDCANVEKAQKNFDGNGNDERDIVNVSPDSGGERVCANVEKLQKSFDGNENNERDVGNVIPDSGGERACANVEKHQKNTEGNGKNEPDVVNVTPDSGGERDCTNVEKPSKNFVGNGNNERDVVNVSPDSGGERACANVEKPHKNFDGNGNNECDVVNVTPDSGGKRACTNVEKPRKNFDGNGNTERDVVNVAPNSSGKRVCGDIEKPLSGKIYDVDGDECDIVDVTSVSGAEKLCANAKKPPTGNVFSVDRNERDAANVTPDYGGERACSSAKKPPGNEHDAVNASPNSGGKSVCGNTEKPPCGNIFGWDVMDIDSPEEETCIKCNSGGEVLLCCETGCPVALHGKCVGSEPIFDDSGKFYCHYCLYKRATARTRELLEKAMEAKKELSMFLHHEPVGGDKGTRKGKQTNSDEPYASVFPRNRNHLDHENIRDDDTVDNQIGQSMEARQTGREENIANRDHAAHSHEEAIRGADDLQDNVERKKQREDETSTAYEHEHGPCKGVDDDRQQAEPSNDKMNVDGSLNTSTKQDRDNSKASEEILGRNEEQMQRQTKETVESSTRDKHERCVKQRTQNPWDPYSFDSPSKPATQLKGAAEANARTQRYRAEKFCKDGMEKNAATKISRQQQGSTRQASIFFDGKRKRLLWTAEEEEMIEKGVNIVSSTTYKNIPWREILAHGSHVFHPSRNPADLKNKWKTMSKAAK